MSEQNEIHGVQYEGILEKGYGLIPQLLMRDKTLSIEAKAIYAYLAAFAGTTQKAFPGVKLICGELNISENRYLKHRKQLLDKGYIEIQRKRLESGFSKNIYSLKQSVPVHLQNVGIGNEAIQNVGIGNVGIGNEGTKSNISKNNISKNNSIQKQQLQKGNQSSLSSEIFKLIESNNIAVLTDFTASEVDYMINDTSEELVLQAVKIAVENNARNLKYIKSIIRNWHNKGYKTIDQVNAAEKQRKGKPQQEASNYMKETYGDLPF